MILRQSLTSYGQIQAPRIGYIWKGFCEEGEEKEWDGEQEMVRNFSPNPPPPPPHTHTHFKKGVIAPDN